MAWIISTPSPRMISAEEVWHRFSSRGRLDIMRRIVFWRWGYIVVDEEPTWHELNSDDGLDVKLSEIIDYDFRECEYIWEPKDRKTNRLVEVIDDIDELYAALEYIGWRRVENNITMWGVLQKAESRKKAKVRPRLQNYGLIAH